MTNPEHRSPPDALIPRSFRAVNGWRGPGAIAIALAHFALATGLVARDDLKPAAVIVDMFFVFSGLVISQAYAAKLARPSAIPEYLVRRIGRIWPVQAVTLAVLIGYEFAKLVVGMATGAHFASPAFARDGGRLLEAIPTNLLLIQSLGLHDRETWNFPSWSLSVEFATYVIFAALCLLRPWLRYAISLIAILACLAVLGLIAPHHMESTFDYGLFRCLAGFLAGALCREVAVQWRLPAFHVPTLVEVGTILLFGLWLLTASDRWSIYASPLAVCLFVMAFVPERGALSRVLASKPLQILAEASFAIYMVHAIVLIGLLAALHKLSSLSGHPFLIEVANPYAGLPGAPPTVQLFRGGGFLFKTGVILTYAALVGGATYLSYRWIEVPGRAAFSRLARKLARDRPDGSASIALPQAP